MTVERDWFWFYYALWLASVFTLVLVLRQSSENRSISKDNTCLLLFKQHTYMASGSEVCKHGKVPKANTNLFYFISLRASLEPGSTLVGKGEKNHVGEKKKKNRQAKPAER